MQSVIRAWEMFPTGDFLRSHGIVPSNKTSYTLQQMQDAVKAHTGVIPYFGCTGAEAPEGDGRTVVDEVKQLDSFVNLNLTCFLAGMALQPCLENSEGKVDTR